MDTSPSQIGANVQSVIFNDSNLNGNPFSCVCDDGFGPVYQAYPTAGSRQVKILERAETMGDGPTRSERPWEDLTHQFRRVTLCYVRFGVFPGTARSARNHDWIQTDQVL